MLGLTVLVALLLGALGPAAAQPEGELLRLSTQAAARPLSSLGARPQTWGARRPGLQAPPTLQDTPARATPNASAFRPLVPPCAAANLLLSLPEACAENWAAATADLVGAPWLAGSPPCGGAGAQPWLGVTCNEQGQVVKL